MQRDTSSSSASASASAVSFCPSFNTYSSDKLADIVAKVSKELNLEESNSKQEQEQQHNNDDEDDDFEFFSRFDAQIHQVFPVFNRDLLKGVDYYYPYNQGDERSHVETEPGRPLKKLFVDDDDDDQGAPQSSSSSDADEPEKEEVPELTFCIWSPKRNPVAVECSPSRCKKSNSTGSSAASVSASASPSSSKKWLKFRDLLKRSNSDGKDSFVFLCKPKERKDSKEVIKSRKAAVSAHEAFYVKNRAIKEGDKKRSYLPYRQDLLGFFTNYNRLHKTLPPF